MTARHLRVATFNINGIRSRLPSLLEWLAREKPDIAEVARVWREAIQLAARCP